MPWKPRKPERGDPGKAPGSQRGPTAQRKRLCKKDCQGTGALARRCLVVPLHTRAHGGAESFCVGVLVEVSGRGAICSLYACGSYLCTVSLMPRVPIV